MRRGELGRHGGERGANLVEMSLVTVLLLLLLAGVADLGRVFYHYIVVTNAAREGARYASHYPWQYAKIRERVRQEATTPGVNVAALVITITPEPAGCADPTCAAQPGEPIWVGVQYSVNTLMGNLVGANPIILRRAAQMVVFGADLP